MIECLKSEVDHLKIRVYYDLERELNESKKGVITACKPGSIFVCTRYLLTCAPRSV